MIQVHKLHKYFNKGKNNEIHVINDTTLELPEQGLVCILGESGSGKTTLLNTLGGLDDYSAGEITITGETLITYSPEKMDRIRTEHCAYVFQNYYLLSDHTVDYNIRLVLNMYDLSEEEKSQRIDYVLQAVDMLKYKKRQVSQLSGGQQQRIAIARALAKTPKIIFADEPTGNLDEANTMRVMHILKKVSENCLVVMVTHETCLAEVFADRIISVENGKVVSDTSESEKENTEYSYEDDSTIYLKEYQKDVSDILDNEQIKVEYYHHETASKVLPITIRVIEENGRYYIQTLSDSSMTVITPNSKKQILDEERPSIAEEIDAEFVYDLETLACRRMPKLSMREIFRVAWRNLSLLGKQQMFLVVSFVAMAVLFVLTMADILTLSTIDVRSVVHSDERELVVEVKKNGGFDWDTFDAYFDELMDGVLEITDLDHIKYDYDSVFYIEYKGFEQIQDVEAMLTGYSFSDIKDLSEEQLVAGRMPEQPTEIVVDTWVLEHFIKNEPSLSQLLPEPEDYIGKEISIKKKMWTLTIVGVCDTDTPNIYMDKCVRLSLGGRVVNTIATLDMLQGVNPEKYGNLMLQEDEILISEEYKQQLESLRYDTSVFHFDNALSFPVVGTFSEDLGVDYIFSDGAYEKLLTFLVNAAKGFIVSTEEKEVVLEHFASLPETLTNHLQIFVLHPYGEELATYENARAIKLDARLIITITIFFVSMVLLYFSMKSNAMKKIEDIMVYRVLGIQKRSILLIFAIESMLLTLYTSVPAVLITSAVLKFVVSIPSLELDMVYPWSAAIGIIVFLFVINIVTGVLPIIRLVRKPPAQLTVS